MAPLTAETIAAIVKAKAAEAMTAQSIVEAESGVLSLDAGLETAAEAHEAIIGEQGLIQQLDSIRFESMEALAARNEAALSEMSQIEANRISGAAREEVVGGELAREYPAENGNHIERECYLRNAEGHVVKDPETGEARRIDRVVLKNGEVVKSVEVTSETADKTAQMAKEERIREVGGNYIVDRRNGEIVPFAHGVKTEIVRRA